MLLQVPLGTLDIQRAQQTQLLRFILFCTDIPTMQYYAGLALEMMHSAAPYATATCTDALHSAKISDDIVLIRFTILIAMHISAEFWGWIGTYSSLDAVITKQFGELLGTHVRILIEHLDVRGLPTDGPGDVLYPSITHFVVAMMKLFARLS